MSTLVLVLLVMAAVMATILVLVAAVAAHIQDKYTRPPLRQPVSGEVPVVAVYEIPYCRRRQYDVLMDEEAEAWAKILGMSDDRDESMTLGQRERSDQAGNSANGKLSPER